MSLRVLLVGALLALSGSPAVAQIPFPRDLLPKREALSRLGLERQWYAIVPLTGNERMISLSHFDGLIFARTDKGFLHTYDSESGKHLWTRRLGPVTGKAVPSSANKFAVFATNLNYLYALDRKTGNVIWSHDLAIMPSAPTTCDAERAVVPLANGKIYGYNLIERNVRDATAKISPTAVEAWNWQTSGEIATRPLLAGKVVLFGSNDGKVYAAFSDERTMLYRILTGGPIGEGFGIHDTRLLLVPSADRNLYGVDVLTAQVLWTYPSGAPIHQAPMVAGDDVFVVNQAGTLASLDYKTGSPLWTASTLGGRPIAAGEKRLYLLSQVGDLMIIDRGTGQLLFSTEATANRVGLKLREYTMIPTNLENDRIYLATPSGMMVSLHETGRTTPLPLRDPNAKPFAYVPPEGVPQSTLIVAPPAEGAAAPPDGEAVKPAEPATPPGDEPK